MLKKSLEKKKKNTKRLKLLTEIMKYGIGKLLYRCIVRPFRDT